MPRPVNPPMHRCRQTRFVLCALGMAACGGAKAPLESLSGASTTGATSTGSSGSSTSGGTTGQSASTSAGATSGASSTGGTSSGSTSGGTTGGCLTEGRGGVVGNPCLSVGDCACPLVCHTSVCVQACATTADCTAADRSCQHGFCLYNVCSTFDTPCDSAGDGDGTCLGVSCVQAGTAAADGACDPNAVRQMPQDLCSVGYLCLDLGIPGVAPACSALCDPQQDAGNTCPAGEGCASSNPSFGIPSQGQCIRTGAVGCAQLATDINTERNPCLVPTDCVCPNICTDAGMCRIPCVTSTDCPQSSESLARRGAWRG